MKKYICEFIGTFALIFAGTGVIISNDFSSGRVGYVGIAIVFGLIVSAMIYSTGDISSANSKGFAQLPLRKFDYVISLGCKDTCPFVPANKHLEWKIEDPKGKDIDFFRKIRDNIEEKVNELIRTIA
jgi:hypothetical protein